MRRRARVSIAVPLAIACTVSEPSPTREEPPAPSTPVAVPEPGRSPAEVRAQGNHLVGEPSPYLEEHAHNPVDWYPWGPEAIAKAKREKKAIFLSIGYSTCHWCHVMERESFEDDEVAAYLNANFVSIKVDREWRPDVDAIYIDAVAALGGSTGWPLTVFLTPELEPFFGGTYYPRHAQGGRPGFLDVLHEVHGTWTSEGERAAERGREVLARIEAQARAAVKSPAGLGTQTIDEAMRTLASARDTTEGGFGRRQKFPNAPLLLAQLRHVRRTGDESTREHLVLTLEQMMRGGLRDHVGGGFHRYTVDPSWHMPHFEKTLYDNAQLAAVYVEAGRVLERDDFVATGRAALDELIEAWQEPSGGFVVGFDADDPGGEGAFYAWTPGDLQAALGPEDARLVAALFGVSARGEAELDGASVLHRRPDSDVATELGIARRDLATASTRALATMKTVRARRPAPRRDDKLLAGWNGLAIAALADAGRWLDEPRYVEAARRAGSFVVDRCWQDGRMLRGRRGDASLGEGVLEDYALVGLALIRLHAATGDPQWLTHARAIGMAIVERFHDAEAHAFVRTPAEAEGVPIRMVDLSDGVLPSGGSAAIVFLLELGALAGDAALHGLALDMLQRVAGSTVARPTQSGFLLVALDHATAPVREVVLAGDESDPLLVQLWREVRPSDHARVLPVRVPAAGAAPDLSAAFPALQGKIARQEKATAYVCEQGRCELPTSEPKRLREQLDAAFAGDTLAQAARPRG